MKTGIFFTMTCACVAICACSKDESSQGVWGGTGAVVPQASVGGIASVEAGSASAIVGEDSWSAIIYDDAAGRYLAVGESDAVAFSTDGTTWTRTTVDNVTSWKGAACGDGKYVIAGGYGTVAVSEDGKEWTRMSVSASPVYGAAYGNGKFVVAGSSSVYTSSDGNEWTASSAGGINFNDLTYGGNQFVAACLGSVIAWSADGLSWTAVTVEAPVAAVAGEGNAGDAGEAEETSPVSWYDVAYNGTDRYVAVGMASRTYQDEYGRDETAYDGCIAVSDDGKAWTVTRYPDAENSNVVFRAVDFNNGTFVVAGADGDVRYSSDASSWTPVEGSRNDLNAVCVMPSVPAAPGE